MSYGFEFKNLNGDRVIDEENEVLLVSEKGSISGVRTAIFGAGDSVTDDFAGKWVRVTSDGTASGRTKFYLSNIVLSSSYITKPLLALRGLGGAYATLPLAYVRRHNSTSFNAIRFISRTPIDIDFILASEASLASAASKSLPVGDTHGVKVAKANADVVFDSRWPEIFSVTDSKTFPVLPTSNYIDNGVPSSNVSITDTPGAFFTLDSLYGFHPVVEQVEQEEEFGATLLLFGGGKFYPTVRQTSSTLVKCTMANTEEGDTQSATGGAVETGDVNFKNTGGNFLVIRYLNF